MPQPAHDVAVVNPCSIQQRCASDLKTSVFIFYRSPDNGSGQLPSSLSRTIQDGPANWFIRGRKVWCDEHHDWMSFDFLIRLDRVDPSIHDNNELCPADGSAGKLCALVLSHLVQRCCLRGADGGAYRDRTDDPLLAKQVLSQLS